MAAGALQSLGNAVVRVAPRQAKTRLSGVHVCVHA